MTYAVSPGATSGGTALATWPTLATLPSASRMVTGVNVATCAHSVPAFFTTWITCAPPYLLAITMGVPTGMTLGVADPVGARLATAGATVRDTTTGGGEEATDTIVPR
jgi:hypothetical protein